MSLPPKAPERFAEQGIAAGPEKPALARAEDYRRVDARLVSLSRPASLESDYYRLLRHKVEELRRAAGVSIIAVSSPVKGDGKTTTAINLAGALSQSKDHRVLLVDCDFRAPSMARYLKLARTDASGLADLIRDPRLPLEQVVRTLPIFNLSVLPTGRLPAIPYELLKSPSLGRVLEEAGRRYDFIIVDTPPLIPVPDCRVVAEWVYGVLLVVAAHKTPGRLVDDALRALEPHKILGLVFNGDDDSRYRYYRYYADHA